MTNLTPEQAYERYVGQITPEEFVEPYEGDHFAPINEVLKSLTRQGIDHPENLEHQLDRYLISQGV